MSSARTIKVGVIADQTGPLSFVGNANANVARMVIGDINAKGGLLGRQLELCLEDSATDDSNMGAAPFVTANDTGDGDSGGNNLQNYPLLSSAVISGGTQLIVSGTLNSNASSYYRIEFFGNTSPHASGQGGGQTYLGFANVATNGSGNASFSTTLTTTVAMGSYVLVSLVHKPQAAEAPLPAPRRETRSAPNATA